jgi:hypothetical protein
MNLRTIWQPRGWGLKARRAPFGVGDTPTPRPLEPRVKTPRRTVAPRRTATPVDYIDFAPYTMPVEERRELDVGDIYINQARHTTCGWYIRSRNRRDHATCHCGELSIDGGSWYTRLTGDIAHADLHTVYYKQRPRP